MVLQLPDHLGLPSTGIGRAYRQEDVVAALPLATNCEKRILLPAPSQDINRRDDAALVEEVGQGPQFQSILNVQSPHSDAGAAHHDFILRAIGTVTPADERGHVGRLGTRTGIHSLPFGFACLSVQGCHVSSALMQVGDDHRTLVNNGNNV